MKKRFKKLFAILAASTVLCGSFAVKAGGTDNCFADNFQNSDMPFVGRSDRCGFDDVPWDQNSFGTESLNLKENPKKQSVYLGGIPIGIRVCAKGLIVAGIGSVVTPTGLSTPLADTGVRAGDVLVAVDGNSVCTTQSLEAMIRDKNQIEAEFLRKNQTFSVIVNPAVNALTGKRSLGLRVKECVDGIGTLTFVKSDGSFGALGHIIYDVETGLSAELNSGEVFEAMIESVEKGKKGMPGSLNGHYNGKNGALGSISENTRFGVFGNLALDGLNLQTVEIASPDEVKPGKAYVYATVFGDEPDYYEINIVKSASSGSPKEKGLLISVTDRRLLQITGGIVQGMSGSPIIQNGKLAGALTHVFVNDPTKGYGIYIGWML